MSNWSIWISYAFKVDELSAGGDFNHERITVQGAKRSLYKHLLATHSKKQTGDSQVDGDSDVGLLYAAAMTPEEVDRTSCYSLLSQFYSPAHVSKAAPKLETALRDINEESVWLMIDPVLERKANIHFYSERLTESNARLVRLRRLVRETSAAREWQSSRRVAGQYLHTLQDFYSSSNWVELGNEEPNYNLGVEGGSLGILASEEDPACIPCANSYGDCRSNIHPWAIENKLLSSGYRSGATDNTGHLITKPNVHTDQKSGKCSHGGYKDSFRRHAPIGGINKEATNERESPHHFLHEKAANLAVRATEEFFDSILKEQGVDAYLGVFNLRYKNSLAIVMDDTGSMSDELEAAKNVSYDLIQQYSNGSFHFVLSQFNDPGFGLTADTENSAEFIKQIESIKPYGGGDAPEYCLSGLRVALERCLPDSSVFVFTDAAAKDYWELENVKALIAEKSVKVNFMLTDFKQLKRRERKDTSSSSQITTVTLYENLAAMSGGAVIYTTSMKVNEAVNFIKTRLSREASVSILEVAKVTDYPMNSQYEFYVDSSVTSMRFTLTSRSVAAIVNVSSRHGSEFPHSETSLENIEISTIDRPAHGRWTIQTFCRDACHLTVTGQSDVSFMYEIRQAVGGSDGTHSTVPLTSRPTAGSLVTVFVTALMDSASGNSSSIRVRKLQLISSGGSTISDCSPRQLPTTLDYICSSVTVPREAFRLGISAIDDQNTTLQRVSTDLHIPTFVSISSPSTLYEMRQEEVVRVDLTIHSSDRNGTFLLSWNNQTGISITTESTSIQLRNGTAVVAFYLKYDSKDTGSAFSKTIRINADALSDSSLNNFQLLKVLLPRKAKRMALDTESPNCTLLPQKAISTCEDMSTPADCSASRWSAGFEVTDVNSGISSVDHFPREITLKILHTDSTGLAGSKKVYIGVSGSCCFRYARLLVIDKAGNSRICSVGDLDEALHLLPPPPTDGGTQDLDVTQSTLAIAMSVTSFVLVAALIAFLSHKTGILHRYSLREKAPFTSSYSMS